MSRTPPTDSLASFAEAFGYTHDADYVRIFLLTARHAWKRYDGTRTNLQLHAAHHAKYAKLAAAVQHAHTAVIQDLSHTLFQIKDAVSGLPPEAADAVLRPMRAWQALQVDRWASLGALSTPWPYSAE